MECSRVFPMTINFFLRRVKFYQNFFQNPSKFQFYKPDIYIRMSLIIFGFIPLIANIFALFVLRRPQMKKEQPTFRHHLLLLTLSETFYCVTFINLWIWDVVFIHMATSIQFGHAPSYIITLFTGLLYAALTTRNWVVVAISVARCEVILRPLNSLKRKVVTSRRVRLFAVFVLCSALALSYVSFFSSFWEVGCVELHESVIPSRNETRRRKQIFVQPSVLTQVRALIKKCYARGLPMVLVIVTTIIMIVSIRTKSRALPQDQSHIKSASITLVAFTIIFVVIEGIGFVFYVSDVIVIFRKLGILSVVFKVSFAVDHYLLLFNSMTNVLVFVAFHKSFRKEVKRIFRGPTSHPQSSQASVI